MEMDAGGHSCRQLLHNDSDCLGLGYAVLDLVMQLALAAAPAAAVVAVMPAARPSGNSSS